MNLWNDLRFLSGLNALFESFFISKFPQNHARLNTAQKQAVLKLEELLGEVKSAILLDTSSYKPTSLVGIVEAKNSSKSFIKIYPEEIDLPKIRAQQKLIEDLTDGIAGTCDLLVARKGVLIYDFIGRTVLRKNRRLVQKTAMLLSKSTFKNRDSNINPKDLCDYSLNADNIHQTFDKIDFKSHLTNLQRRARHEPLLPCHGDLTTWNSIISEDQSVHLVDYENVGFFPPFFDYIHFVLQPKTLKTNFSINVSKLTKDIAKEAEVSEHRAALWIDLWIAYSYKELNDKTNSGAKLHRLELRRKKNLEALIRHSKSKF